MNVQEQKCMHETKTMKRNPIQSEHFNKTSLFINSTGKIGTPDGMGVCIKPHREFKTWFKLNIPKQQVILVRTSAKYKI